MEVDKQKIGRPIAMFLHYKWSKVDIWGRVPYSSNFVRCTLKSTSFSLSVHPTYFSGALVAVMKC